MKSRSGQRALRLRPADTAMYTFMEIDELALVYLP